MAAIMPYSASLAMPGSAGNVPAAQATPSNEHANSVVESAKTKPVVVHYAVAVIVGAIVILAVGRGYLRNARIA